VSRRPVAWEVVLDGWVAVIVYDRKSAREERDRLRRQHPRSRVELRAEYA
jgi:hypothetical protein